VGQEVVMVVVGMSGVVDLKEGPGGSAWVWCSESWQQQLQHGWWVREWMCAGSE
jgi:hypothetical protein